MAIQGFHSTKIINVMHGCGAVRLNSNVIISNFRQQAFQAEQYSQ